MASDIPHHPHGPAAVPQTVETLRDMVVMAGVQKYFGDHHVLKDVDLTIAEGEVVVVVGPSGSGKSTLCRCINRLESISSGEIRIDGSVLPEEGRALANLRADVGMVFQSFNLFAHRTILENVTLAPITVRGNRSARPGSTASNCSTAWASPTRRTACPLSSPEASSSVLPSREPSPCARR